MRKWQITALVQLAVLCLTCAACRTPDGAREPREMREHHSRLRDKTTVQQVARLLGKLEADDWDDYKDKNKLTIAVMEAGDTVLPVLQAALRRNQDEESRSVILMTAAYLGGSKAVDLLRRELDGVKDEEKDMAKATLCIAMASTGTVEDRRFLVHALKGETIGDEWFSIVEAAFALGTLRAEEARPALQALTRTDEDSFASEAAKEALAWMDVEHYAVPSWMEKNEKGRIKAAVMRNGIPNTDRSFSYRDGEEPIIWSKQDGAWQSTPAASESKDLPSITFDIHRARGDTRAFVSVWVRYGPLDATGYDYVLRKSEGTWEAVAVVFTMVS